jgi:hypothetical protein
VAFEMNSWLGTKICKGIKLVKDWLKDCLYYNHQPNPHRASKINIEQLTQEINQKLQKPKYKTQPPTDPINPMDSDGHFNWDKPDPVDKYEWKKSGEN